MELEASQAYEQKTTFCAGVIIPYTPNSQWDTLKKNYHYL